MRRSFLILGTAILISASVNAQIGLDNVVLSPNYPVMTNNVFLTTDGEEERFLKLRPDLDRPVSKVIPENTGRYRPSEAQTKANLAQFVSQTRARSPAGAAELERMFASVDVLGETGKAMRSVGLDPHNVADAYALWWVQAWSNANMVESPDDAETYQAVQRQARGGFAATPAIATQGDAEKQQFAEAMIVQAAIMNASFASTEGDSAIRKQLAAAAKKGAKQMGLDLDTMVLTKDGFRPRKGAALDPSDTDERLAAADGGSGETTPLLTYAAIAAAGGVALAAVFLAGKAVGRRG